jgi:hypothetical protein
LDMKEQAQRNHAAMLERIRSEFESLLTVLVARASCAKDQDDWKTIVEQTKELAALSRRGALEAGRQE